MLPLLQVGQGDTVQRLDLGLNKSLVIDLPEDAFDILVADPTIADAVTRSARRIYLFGRKVGETNIFVFGEDGQTIANIDLSIERDVSSLEGDLERFIPGSDIEVEIVNDNVVLTGFVLTPQDANRAEQLATAFLLGGTRTEAQNDAERTSQIVNLLSIAGEDQVTLKLTVAEVQRSVVKQLGVSLNGGVQTQTLGDGFNLPNDLTGSIGAGMNTASARGQFGVGGTVGFGDFSASLNATIDALNEVGAIRTLAEPNLTAVSGEVAEFRVGGEIGYTVNRINEQGIRIAEIERVEYGVELEFKPVVLSSGRISINVGTAVSEPVPSNNIFTLRQRVARTTVEVPSGGSFMIAGLISDSVRQNVRETPGLARIPILGSLFRSREFLREETEMVIIATPYLVRPTPRSALQAPTDNFHPANDSKGFFLGQINRIYGNSKNTDQPFHGNVGFVYK